MNLPSIARKPVCAPVVAVAAMAAGSAAQTSPALDVFSITGRGFGRIDGGHHGPFKSGAAAVCGPHGACSQSAVLTAIAPCGDFRALPTGRALSALSVAQLQPVGPRPHRVYLGGVTPAVRACVEAALQASATPPALPGALPPPSASMRPNRTAWLPVGAAAVLWAAAGYVGDKLWLAFGQATRAETERLARNHDASAC